MNTAAPVTIPVGIVIERRKSSNRWIDFTWRPVAILAGTQDTKPWTILSEEADVTTFYAGADIIALHPSEAENYRYNLASARPQLWVKLRASGRQPPFDLAAVTADPGEGESFTEVGDDLVEALPMPEPVRATVERFVAEHYVERKFSKRKRDRQDPEALSRRPPVGQDRKHD
jgi:hypothetical protein